MDSAAGAPGSPSLIPFSKRDVTADWVTCLLTSHLGDDVTVEQFTVAEEECDHALLLRVEFECSFSSQDDREMSPPLTANGADDEEFPLTFTACVDPEVTEVSVEHSDNAVIEELEYMSLPEGATPPPEEGIQLLISVEGAEGGERSPSFYLSSSEDEDSLLPAVVTFPASGERSPASSVSVASDLDGNDQTAGRKFLWTVKMPPRGPFGKLFSRAGLSRDRELTLLSLIAARIETLPAPGCVYCETDDDEGLEGRHWVLVIEDVRSQGGLSLPEPLTSEAMERVVDTLAENAALFLKFQHHLLSTEGRHVTDTFPALRSSELELGRHPLSSDHAGACMREISSLLKPMAPDLAMWLLSRADSAMDTFLRLTEIEYDDELAVLVNGFCCLENIVVSEGDRLILVNWHRFRYSRLTFDLAYFLLASTSLQFRRQHSSSLLRRFTSAVQSRLKDLEIPPPPRLNIEEVAEDFEQSVTLALFWAGTDICRKLERVGRGPSMSSRPNGGDRHPSDHVRSGGLAEDPSESAVVEDFGKTAKLEEVPGSGHAELKQTTSGEKEEMLNRLRDMVEEVRDLNVIK